MTYQARLLRRGCGTCANRLIIRGNPLSLDASKWWRPSIVFQYTNGGYYSVWKISSTGTYTMVKGWTLSSAIVKGGWNSLKVVAVSSTLRYYINNVLVYTGASAISGTGGVGIGMYRDSTSTSNAFYVDSASLATTATADPLADVAAESGVAVPGGNFNQSP
jgi:hypothetical protein